MKKYLLLLILFPLTSFATGGFVQVSHTVQNIQGVGTLKPSDMSSVINYNNDSTTQSGDGAIQLYDLGDSNTDYEVTAPFIPNYEYTTAGDCSGTVSENKVKMCVLQWTDTGPAEAPVVVTQPAMGGTAIAQDDSQEIEVLQKQLMSLLMQLIELLKLQLALK